MHVCTLQIKYTYNEMFLNYYADCVSACACTNLSLEVIAGSKDSLLHPIGGSSPVAATWTHHDWQLQSDGHHSMVKGVYNNFMLYTRVVGE